MTSARRFRDLYAPSPARNRLQGLVLDGLVYGTGIEAATPAASRGTAEIRRQTAEAIDEMQRVLLEAGGSLDNLGRVVAFMRSPGTEREALYDVWEQRFPDAADKPAFKVLDADLPEGTLLRLDFVALLGHRRTRFDIPGVDARDPTVRIGNFVFTSRLHGTSPETGKTVGGLSAQAKQAVANGIRLVELAGGARGNVSQITAFGRDLAYLPELRRTIAEQFAGVEMPAVQPVVTFIRDELEVMVEFAAVL